MSRLTDDKLCNAIVNDTYIETKDLDEMKKRPSIQELYIKLNKYEQLEEQIGCPLDVVFKALKDGIYTKESELDKELELYDVRGIELKGLGVISKICSYGECDFTCYYTDYKKTWWLKEDKSE